ncbi:MAG: S41 family peptidase [Candidatus Eisenbacteria bacterium]
MKRVGIAFLLCLLHISLAHSQQHELSSSPQNEWSGSVEQKLWGLMTIWSEARYAFPHFEMRPDLDWDEKVQEYIPRVLATPDMESYYRVLMEFAALLDDGHTAVIPPWGYFTPGYDTPPIEITVVEGKFVVARAGDTDEIAEQQIYPGLEILEIGEHEPIRTYFRNQVLRYYSQGSPHADDGMLVVYLLYGPKDEPIQLTVKDPEGTIRAVRLTRNSTTRDGTPFVYGFIQQSLFAEHLESAMLADEILYVNIPNFSHDQIAIDFLDLLERVDLASLHGMILNVRQNMGGSSRVCNQIIASLIETPVSTTHWHYPQHIAAYRAWGLEEPLWATKHGTITPRDGKRYTGPLVILTSPVTNSSSEDFAIILQYAGRAVVVGQRTAGGAGNPLTVPLPGGGVFEVSTFKATHPDGTAYASLGIQPDIEVYPTLQDIITGSDRVLETGITAMK